MEQWAETPPRTLSYVEGGFGPRPSVCAVIVNGYRLPRDEPALICPRFR